MVFIETSVLTRQIQTLLQDQDYAELQKLLTGLPAAGDLIRGSRGCRKLRWSTHGKGKRGGIRVVYYPVRDKHLILMLLAYAKTSTGSLTRAQINQLGDTVINELKER